MPSEFAERAHVAFANLTVPAPPLGAIRARAERRSRQHRAALAVLCSTVLVCAIGLASGAGAAITSQIRVWLSGGRASLVIHGLTTTKYPTSADVAEVTRRATFPVVLPVGLPRGSHLWQIMSSPPDRPTTITLLYVSAGGANVGVTLVDPKSIEHGAQPASSFSTDVTSWTLRGETLLVKNPEIARATRVATAASALAANEAMTVHGFALDAHQLAQIPRHATAKKALLDNRTVILTNIPQVDGAPDYLHAQLQWPHHVALSPGAVEEVAAYLRAHPSAHPPLVYVPDAPVGRRVSVLSWGR